MMMHRTVQAGVMKNEEDIIISSQKGGVERTYW
jgi:hypothetical protein